MEIMLANSTHSGLNEFWALSKTDIYKLSYKWTINNFSLHGITSGDKLASPSFSAREDTNTELELLLYPNGVDRDSNGFISLFLGLKSTNRKQINTKITFTIISHAGKSNFQKCCVCKFNLFGRMGIAKFISRDTLLNNDVNNLLSNDVLVILTEIDMLSELKNMSGRTDKFIDENIQNFTKDNCLQEFQNLFEKNILCDVVLQIENKEIRAHKAVLAARSPVFCAMFKHNMIEKNLSIVNITDINYETLNRMLCFIYCGKVPAIEKYAKELLIAADKYDLTYLKMLSEVHIRQSLNIENAAGIFIWADVNNVLLIKSSVLDFIKGKNLVEIFETDGWKEIVTKHPQLLAEIFKNLIDNNE